MRIRLRSWRGWDWLAPLAAAFGLLALVVSFLGELHEYRWAVIGWAERDLTARTELAASTLAEPLRTSDFRSIHAFGDACAAEGVRLTVFSGHGGVFFDSLRRGSDEPHAMYVEQPCGEYVVRLGLPYERVLAPVEKAQKGLVLAACLGGFAVLIVFFFTYRQRVRIRELARLEKFRRDFISDVSHEIKTPLTGILGAVDMLDDVTRQAAASTVQARLVELIRKESKRLNGLVQSILDLSRLERPEGALNVSETDLSTLVADLAAEQGVATQVAEGVVSRCDAQLIAQAVQNLIGNAKRHSGTTDIAVTLDATAANVRIAVEDHGVGIPSEHRARVFERFHRVDPARAAETGGAGLGLAIVRRIARLHGGDVTLAAARPSGCRFELVLPRA